MKKTILTTVLALSLGATAFAGSHYNPFDEMFKQQAKRETRMGVAQYNYLLKDEKSAPIADAQLCYVNRDNKQFTANSDAQGKVHLEFTHPNFVQLVSVKIAGVEYRVIGDDISDSISYKDIGKGDVDYYVLQKHTANQAMYVYEAD